MKTVIVRYHNYGNPRDFTVFSSTRKLLNYYKKRHPRAKRLRIKEFPRFIQVLNHNTPVDFSIPVIIKRVTIDEQID